MKKWIGLLLLCMVICLGGCGSAKKSESVSGTLPEIMKEITTDVGIETKVMEKEISEQEFSSYFFIEPVKGAQALVSEAAMSSIAHTVQLVRVPEGSKVEEIRAEIEKNLNPRKWVCVEAEKTAVVAKGDVILVVMSFTDVVDKVVEKFEAL